MVLLFPLLSVMLAFLLVLERVPYRYREPVFAHSLVLPRVFNQSFVDTELVPIIVSGPCKMNTSDSVSFHIGHIRS